MKLCKFFLGFALLFQLCSCSYYDISISDFRHSQKEEALKKDAEWHRASPKDVINYLSANGCIDTKAADKHYEILPFVDTDEDTLMYIIQYDEGWKILSADKRTPALLASASDGICPLMNEKDPAFSWLNGTAADMKKILYADNDQLSFSDDEILFNISRWSEDHVVDPGPIDTTYVPFQAGHWELIDTLYDIELYSQINHLTNTQWDQDYPYNQFCPLDDDGDRLLAGCGAVAGGQMLYFLSQINGSPLYAYEEVPMSQLKRQYSCEVSDSLTKVAHFLREVGLGSNMWYWAAGSWTLPSDIEGMFASYGYTCTLSSYSDDIVSSSLSSGTPILVLAADELALDVPNYTRGHYFLIDGYQQYRQVLVETYNYVYDDADQPHEYVELRHEYTYYSPYIRQIKMNWGWSSQYVSGNNDGWYTLTGDWIASGSSYNSGRILFHDFTQN